MRTKKISDDDISQYCQSVDTLLSSIKERTLGKKGKRQQEEAEENYAVPDEDMFVMT